MNHHPTLVDKIYELQSSTPNDVFLRQPYGDQWKELTYAEAVEKALCLVSAMKEAGLKKGDKVGVYSKNCYQWILAEMAIMLGGFVMVPYYANLVGDALKEVIKLSEIKFLFIGKLENWKDAKSSIPEALPIVRFSTYAGSAEVDRGSLLDDFIKGCEPDSEEFKPALEDVWAVFFTSGTTGVPKGVIMTYGAPANLMMSQEIKHRTFNISGPGKNTFLSYLPLNHIAEQVLIVVGGLYNKGQISFVESIDSFSQNLQDVQPTVFLAVPRIWTKFRQGVLAKIPEKKLNVLLKIPIISKLVKNKIRNSLGLSSPKLVASGASALSANTIVWFQRLGIHIQEAYGMTETMGVVAFDPLDDMRFGKTGRRLEEGQLKIDPDTDEILVKNDWMFSGYYNEAELTKASFTADGFYRTGDTGFLDVDNYLEVKGRVKDTFKTDKGEFIVPIPIEDLFAGNSLIEMKCLVGLGMPQPMLVIKLSELSNALDKQEIKEKLEQALNQANKGLQRYQMIERIVCVSEEWSLENGILTPTMKIKRNVVHEKYKSQYEYWLGQTEKVLIL